MLEMLAFFDKYSLSCKSSRSNKELFKGPQTKRVLTYLKLPWWSDGKASVYNVGDLGLIPGLGRSPGEGNGNPLQEYCLENPMDRGAW